jgi:hypothetical protein
MYASSRFKSTWQDAHESSRLFCHFHSAHADHWKQKAPLLGMRPAILGSVRALAFLLIGIASPNAFAANDQRTRLSSSSVKLFLISAGELCIWLLFSVLERRRGRWSRNAAPWVHKSTGSIGSAALSERLICRRVVQLPGSSKFLWHNVQVIDPVYNFYSGPHLTDGWLSLFWWTLGNFIIRSHSQFYDSLHLP